LRLFVCADSFGKNGSINMRKSLIAVALPAVVTLFSMPVYAQDIFAKLEGGPYGTMFRQGWTCAEITHTITFSADRKKMAVVFSAPQVIFDGKTVESVTYSVLEIQEYGLHLSLDGDNRKTKAGKPLEWLMRPLEGIEGYCWSRTDHAPEYCAPINERCNRIRIGS
jgi:hypothetical protein